MNYHKIYKDLNTLTEDEQNNTIVSIYLYLSRFT